MKTPRSVWLLYATFLRHVADGFMDEVRDEAAAVLALPVAA